MHRFKGDPWADLMVQGLVTGRSDGQAEDQGRARERLEPSGHHTAASRVGEGEIVGYHYEARALQEAVQRSCIIPPGQAGIVLAGTVPAGEAALRTDRSRE